MSEMKMEPIEIMPTETDCLVKYNSGRGGGYAVAVAHMIDDCPVIMMSATDIEIDPDHLDGWAPLNSAWNTRAGEGEDKAKVVRWAVVNAKGEHFGPAAFESALRARASATKDMVDDGYTEDDAWETMIALGYTIAQFELREITAPREDGE